MAEVVSTLDWSNGYEPSKRLWMCHQVGERETSTHGGADNDWVLYLESRKERREEDYRVGPLAL